MLFSIVVQIRVDLNFADKIYYRAVASSIIGGGLIFIYSGSAQFLFKSIVFMVCEHEYMNISPPPPANYRARYGSVLLINVIFGNF